MRFRAAALALLALVIFGRAALAHPHVWVTVRSELVYAENGSLVAIRHKWTFDDMFSAFATQGMSKDKDGRVTAADLATLAEVNVTSLKEFDFFSHARINGKKTEFDAPKDYRLEQDNDLLTLHFTLPFKTAQKAQKLDLDLFDPTYFVAFTLADKEPMVLVGAPAKCELNVARPDEAGASKRLSESFFSSPDNAANYGAQFANKISVKCP